MTAPNAGGDRRTFTPDFLTELFRNPLDPGYADAAARKARDGGPTGWSKRLISTVSALTLMALGMLLVVAYRQTLDEAPARTQARDTLVEQVQRRRALTNELQGQADELRASVAALRERELGGPAIARLRELEAATGLAPVQGDGAKVTIGDGRTPVNPVTGRRDLQGRVKDTDLQFVANTLWAGGAEAIAINGQRLTATSTIRSAGEAILIDFGPVGSPYVISAIGPGGMTDELKGAAYPSRFFRKLTHDFGMTFDVKDGVDDLSLPAAAGQKLRYASPSADSTPSSSGSPPRSAGASATPSSTPSEGG